MNPTLAHPVVIAAKAGLAASAALALVTALGLPDRLSALFVAVVCISPTVYSGLRRGVEQVGASAVGGLVTWALSLFLPAPLVLGLSMFGSIWLAFAVGLGRGYAVAAFTVAYMVVLPASGPAAALELRLASVAVGVLSAIVVNLLVSAASWRRVFARRLAIARQVLAADFAGLARALERPQDAAARQALFEGSFVLLRALFEELSDAGRESRLLGPAPREAIDAAAAAAHHLLAVAHYGKDTVFALEHGRAVPATSQATAATLAGVVGALAAGPGSAEGPLGEAVEAWALARAAERRFAGEPVG